MQINLSELDLYAPNSSCDMESRVRLTIQTANRAFPSLVNFIGNTDNTIEIESYCSTNEDKSRANDLARLFNQYGSDKSTHHNYHYVYAHALTNPNEVTGILEIGLGTNNTSVVSNMGAEGKPGASVRAFRDFCPNAHVYGADVDRGILFQEDRITTSFVDQTRRETVKSLFETMPELDLIIDDGLHSPDANITVLEFALTKVKVGGMVIIEDIANAAKPFWDVVERLIPFGYKSQVVKSNNNYIFVVKRIY